MSKIVDSICESCDSEFSLSFQEGLVKEHDEIFCPFCKKPINAEEEEDDNIPDFSEFDIENY